MPVSISPNRRPGADCLGQAVANIRKGKGVSAKGAAHATGLDPADYPRLEGVARTEIAGIAAPSDRYGEYLALLRKVRGLSSKAAARAAGVHRVSYGRAEGGKAPPLTDAQHKAFAQTLGLDSKEIACLEAHAAVARLLGPQTPLHPGYLAVAISQRPERITPQGWAMCSTLSRLLLAPSVEATMET